MMCCAFEHEYDVVELDVKEIRGQCWRCSSGTPRYDFTCHDCGNSGSVILRTVTTYRLKLEERSKDGWELVQAIANEPGRAAGVMFFWKRAKR